MAKDYDHKAIEKKWRDEWEKNGAYSASQDTSKPKYYALIEFPYPSGAGLHVGHPRPYIGMDLIARKRRRQGFNVLYPIGWDAFGLPTENYAIKTGKDPRLVTKENTDTFRRQIQSLGVSFDWSREINTTDPAYYKWTQWIFIQMFKKGLAYKGKATINWCPKDKIGLANEEVVDGKCERCGTEVEKRDKEQWMLAITKYAERLYDDLDTVDYIARAKTQQRNWIGKSEGAEIQFDLVGSSEKVKVFTTRPDTLFGATYVVLAPEHPLAQSLPAANKTDVDAYIRGARAKQEMERVAEDKEKTGVELKGVRAINPATKEEIPVFVADYVLGHYGTGAVMAVPAHDERDNMFASKYGLKIRCVIDPIPAYVGAGGSEIGLDDADDKIQTAISKIRMGEMLYEGPGNLINSSDVFDGLNNEGAKKKITDFVGGKWATTFKLRDWVFSRQRYWGEPIPMIHCESCGWNPVPESELPITLPEVEKYEPTDNGESPLSKLEDWIKTKCPDCGKEGRRETDVMPNWAGSSWYYLRYTDPTNDTALADPEKLKYWTPVDWYNGGMEHTVLHLLYSRFWHKFLFDIGAVPTLEPYAKRTSHGLILAEGGVKMSKSLGNVVNPDEIVDRFGADSLRVYEMFMGPFDQAIAWSTDGLVGVRRFLERVAGFTEKVGDAPLGELETLLNQSIKKIGDDIELMKFNTSVSQLMILSNAFGELKVIPRSAFETLLELLAPFAPHLTEELWHDLGHTTSIHTEPWPIFDESKLVADSVTIAVQVAGKTKGTVTVQREAGEAEVLKAVQSDEKLSKVIPGSPSKVIFVQGRIINVIP